MGKRRPAYWVIPPRGSGMRIDAVSYPTRKRAKAVSKQLAGSRVAPNKHAARGGCLVLVLALGSGIVAAIFIVERMMINA